MTEWHGISNSKESLYIGRVPGRKSICLYTLEGAVLDVLAYFRNEEAAQKALHRLDILSAVQLNLKEITQ